MYLAFDTETTGLVNFKIPFDQQTSRMVQLGMILLDEKLEIVSEVGVVIKPEGFTIPEKMTEIHGISQSIAEKYGVPLHAALEVFNSFASVARVYIGHNLKFDKAIVASEFARDTTSLYSWLVHDEYCTMLQSTGICKLPGAHGYKWPKLSEAYKFFFNETLIDSHDALTDVRATVRIYKELMNRQKPNPNYINIPKDCPNPFPKPAPLTSALP